MKITQWLIRRKAKGHDSEINEWNGDNYEEIGLINGLLFAVTLKNKGREWCNEQFAFRSFFLCDF